MKPIMLKGLTIYAEDGVLDDGWIVFEEGKITSIGNQDSDVPNHCDVDVFTFSDHYKALPGFVDIHIHGANGADVMDATEEALTTMATILPAEGTTSFLATTMTQAVAAIEAALRNTADFIKINNQAGQAEVLGIHLEGPFVNQTKAGAQPAEYMIDPTPELFDHWRMLADDQIRLVTLAPELPGGLELIKHLSNQGIVASIGHSDATYEQVCDAVEAGATQVTHLFNQMRGLHHREPGVVGGAFLHEKLKAEMIVDGIHVHPSMVRLAYQQKKADGIMLITDAMRAKCLEAGKYELGGQDVFVANGQATLTDGTLAGSVLKLKEAALNMITFTGCDWVEIIEMASVNPAKQIGVFDRKGSLKVGKDADLIILDENDEIVYTFCRGQLAYEKGGFSHENH